MAYSNPTRGFRSLLSLPLVLAALVAASCGTGPTASAPPPTVALSQSSQSSASAPPSSVTCAAQTLAGMTEEQRIGQLLVLGISGASLSTAEIGAIRNYHLGSTFLVGNRNGGVASVRTLSAAIQALATTANTHGVHFFVAADQEGGYVQRLSGPGFDTIPTALDQGGLAAADLQSEATIWGRQLAAAGINLNLAPVMDVVPPGQDSGNTPIGALEREYGHDPTTAGDHGAAVVRGMTAAGIATTLKHFPGLGRVTGNTDKVAAVVDSVTTADDPYLGSFAEGIGAGAPFVMISLATYSAIDPANQAVFSPTIIGTLLRGRLGFDGVVISDDLGATAAVASMAPGDRATAFIAAGGDMVVVAGVAPASQMADAVLTRAAADPGFAAQVAAAALRILEAKAAYGLLSCV
jgi:beta-N-acetylhexosaminidase